MIQLYVWSWRTLGKTVMVSWSTAVTVMAWRRWMHGE